MKIVNTNNNIYCSTLSQKPISFYLKLFTFYLNYNTWKSNLLLCGIFFSKLYYGEIVVKYNDNYYGGYRELNLFYALTCFNTKTCINYACLDILIKNSI